MCKFRFATIVTLLVVGCALTGTATAEEAESQADCPDRELLQTWWHSGRGDNYASGSVAGDISAINAGYDLVRTEACIVPTQASGTKPLWLYWHSDRGDNFTTATTAGRNAAIAAGYSFMRTEGYVYTSKVTGSVPLYTYWHTDRADNFSAASKAGIDSAQRAGYTRVRIEGYVIPA